MQLVERGTVATVNIDKIPDDYQRALADTSEYLWPPTWTPKTSRKWRRIYRVNVHWLTRLAHALGWIPRSLHTRQWAHALQGRPHTCWPNVWRHLCLFCETDMEVK